MKLSILMMVRNEAKFIGRCLEAQKALITALHAELIIVDTGSTDNTVDIARNYTDKIYFHPWHNDFSEIRNITLSYATGEWGLMIDGDEILENARAVIGFLTSRDSRKANTGLLSIRNIADSNDPGNTPSFLSPRLFRITKDFRFEGAIHEQARPKAPYCIIPSTLVHYGYLSTDNELMEKKFQRNGAILKSELEKDPENIFYLYNLSLTYWMHLDHELAVEPAEKAYRLVKEKHVDRGLFVYVYLQLMKAYINTNRYREAEQIGDEALEITRKEIDLCFFAGRIKFLAGKHDEAIRLYEDYLLLRKDYNGATVLLYTVDRQEEAYRDLVVLLEAKAEYETAYAYCRKIESREWKLELLENVTHVFLELNRIDELNEYYLKEIASEDEGIIHREEGVFLRYLYKGKALKLQNPAAYIHYLESAIARLPEAKGVGILKLELANATISSRLKSRNHIVGDTNGNTEMEMLKKQFKENIHLLIDHGKMEEARILIIQYEQLSSELFF